MIEGMKICPISVAELAQVQDIENVCQQFPWSENQLRQSLSVDNRWGLLDATGRLLGFAIIQLILDEASLLNIAVHPDHQRRGIALGLLQHILLELENNGSSCCFLEVRSSNKAAIRLYKQLGFEQVGVRRNYYPATEGYEDAKVFKKLIGE